MEVSTSDTSEEAVVYEALLGLMRGCGRSHCARQARFAALVGGCWGGRARKLLPLTLPLAAAASLADDAVGESAQRALRHLGQAGNEKLFRRAVNTLQTQYATALADEHSVVVLNENVLRGDSDPEPDHQDK